MKKLKYCETLKPGFYLFKSKELNLYRCTYCTGTTKGNKWIELTENGDCAWLDEGWSGVLWNCIPESEISECTFFETNPTKIELI